MAKIQYLRKCHLKKDCDILKHKPKKGTMVFFDQTASKLGFEIMTIGIIGQYHLGYFSWDQIKEYLNMTEEIVPYEWKKVK